MTIANNDDFMPVVGADGIVVPYKLTVADATEQEFVPAVTADGGICGMKVSPIDATDQEGFPVVCADGKVILVKGSSIGPWYWTMDPGTPIDQIFACDDTTLLGVGRKDASTMHCYASTDAGKTWALRSTTAVPTAANGTYTLTSMQGHMNKIQFSSSSMVAGAYFRWSSATHGAPWYFCFQTADQGYTWTARSSGNYPLSLTSDGWASQTTHLTGATGLAAISWRHFGGNRGYKILRTTNGGVSWSDAAYSIVAYTNPVRTHAFDASQARISGNGGVRYDTEDATATPIVWNRASPDTVLDFFAENTANKSYFSFPDSSQTFGTIRKTENQSRTWIEKQTAQADTDTGYNNIPSLYSTTTNNMAHRAVGGSRFVTCLWGWLSSDRGYFGFTEDDYDSYYGYKMLDSNQDFWMAEPHQNGIPRDYEVLASGRVVAATSRGGILVHDDYGYIGGNRTAPPLGLNNKWKATWDCSAYGGWLVEHDGQVADAPYGWTTPTITDPTAVSYSVTVSESFPTAPANPDVWCVEEWDAGFNGYRAPCYVGPWYGGWYVGTCTASTTLVNPGASTGWIQQSCYHGTGGCSNPYFPYEVCYAYSKKWTITKTDSCVCACGSSPAAPTGTPTCC